MKYQSILVTLATMVGLIMASPQGRNRNGNKDVIFAKDVAGGRAVLDGATCTRVQGVLICDDGFGNTL